MVATSPSSSWLVHIKTFVDPDVPASQQVASRDAIADLIRHKTVSLSQIVVEMEDYLTSSNGAIRCRGVLLLGELWMLLLEQPLEENVVHTFVTFFSVRLEDWHSLHGALVGSLALAKRGKNAGVISKVDAEVLVEAALKNLEVQALPQQDRMSCLELFECLLLHHSGGIAHHVSLFADRLCDIVEGEKDPRCLLLVFKIVEVTMKLFPDPMGHIGSTSEDLFGIISCYFPISFNPVPDDIRGITREDLSMALMHCFASTRLFADFCIPLLLEKLSSTLKGAKRDSLKFLGFCVIHYSGDALHKHAAPIWMALKQELIFSQRTEDVNPKEKDELLLAEAQNCFQACIRAFQSGNPEDVDDVECNSFLKMVLEDAFLDDFITCLPSRLLHTDKDVVDSTGALERAKATIEETGSILATAVKASPLSCFAISRTLFPHIFEAMKIGIHVPETDILEFLKGSSQDCSSFIPGFLMETVLKAIRSMVEGAREVAVHSCKSGNESDTSKTDTKWVTPLQAYSEPIMMSFSMAIVAGLHNNVSSKSAEKLWETGVAGLQALGCFPPQIAAISERQYNFVVSLLKGIILRKSEVRPLWSQAVNAIAAICSAEENFTLGRQRCKEIDSIVGLLLSELVDHEKSLPIECNLKALAIICNKKPQTLSGVVRNLTGIVCAELTKLGHMRDAEESAFQTAVPLLQGLLHSILPSCETTPLEEDVFPRLVLDVWGIVEGLPACQNIGDIEGLSTSYTTCIMQVLECSLGVFQFSVSECDEAAQTTIVLKMLDRFLGASANMSTHLTIQDNWIIGLFASVTAMLPPSIQIPQGNDILQGLVVAAVSQSCSSVNNAASEAVGNLLNKLYIGSHTTNSTNGVDAVTTAVSLVLKGDRVPRRLDLGSGACHVSTGMEALLQKRKYIHLLACIGRGLAMRGHIVVSDIAMLLLKLVECKKSYTDLDSDMLLELLWPNDEETSEVSFAAAEALGFISKDCKASFTKQSHLVVKPLYQQRFFVCMLPPLMLALKEADTQGRVLLYCAFGHLVSGIPTNVILTESNKVFPLVLESLSTLCGKRRYSNILLSVLLVLSAILVDKNGGELSSQHVPAIVNRLLTLISYPYTPVVRETSLLCLGTLVGLPYARVFPFRTQILRALTKPLDDPKRAVRKEAVRCRRAWESITR